MKNSNRVIVVGELNVDLILNNIDGYPEKGKEKIADQMTLTLLAKQINCVNKM